MAAPSILCQSTKRAIRFSDPPCLPVTGRRADRGKAQGGSDRPAQFEGGQKVAFEPVRGRPGAADPLEERGEGRGPAGEFTLGQDHHVDEFDVRTAERRGSVLEGRRRKLGHAGGEGVEIVALDRECVGDVAAPDLVFLEGHIAEILEAVADHLEVQGRAVEFV